MSQRRVTIAPAVHCVRVEGDFVLMDVKGGVYLGLDPVASRIWQSLAEHGDVKRAAEDLCLEFDVAPDQALADIEAWVGELRRRGLVSDRWSSE